MNHDEGVPGLERYERQQAARELHEKIMAEDGIDPDEHEPESENEARYDRDEDYLRERQQCERAGVAWGLAVTVPEYSPWWDFAILAVLLIVLAAWCARMVWIILAGREADREAHARRPIRGESSDIVIMDEWWGAE